MQRLVDKPASAANEPFPARIAEENRELALLAQFMRHDLVELLAQAIARSDGSVRAADLIAEARLSPRPDG